MPKPRAAAGASERFAIASCRERWLDFLALEHETLSPAADFAWSDGELLLRREGAAGAPLLTSRVPRPWRAPLLLQAAAAVAFFASRGFPLSHADFQAAVWDIRAGSARLWLTRTPSAVASGVAAPASGVLAGVLAGLCSSAGRLSPGAARELHARLTAPEAEWGRGEHWVAAVLRAFPELSSPSASLARERCMGVASDCLRSVASRALTEKARAILRGRAPRVFQAGVSALTPGGALRLVPPPSGAADATRRLRELAVPRVGRSPAWIAVAPEAWDPVSRRAFDAARRALDGALEVVLVPVSLPAPETPAEWRSAIWAPCGSLAASVRFYEWLASTAGRDARRGRSRVRSALGGARWVAFVTDPTGDAPLPGPSEEDAVEAEVDPRPAAATVREDAGLRIEQLLESGQTELALEIAERWVREFPQRPPEAWFPLAARLASSGGGPSWLEAIEVEREIAGGRPHDAKARLDRLLRSPESDPSDRRRARLRAAEVASLLGRPAEAARRAAEWRRMHPEAPAAEAVRALRLGAAGFSREGRVDCALALLDEAERTGAPLPAGERVETALARARVFALCGRFGEESAVYEAVRPLALGAGDDGLAARFLAQEARGLLDRREHARAVVRLEEAIAVSGSDLAEEAALLLDLATALYHSGLVERAETALAEALRAAAGAGREDLARIARGNRVELLVDRGAWNEAAAEIASLEGSARAEKDSPRLLVALHHKSRLALRRGALAESARDNAEARRLAEEVGDRLEIGELWLEEGDRRLYEGDLAGARQAWELAAAAPPDRCDRDRAARARLTEACWDASAGPPEQARSEVEVLFEKDPYRAAETVARWRCLFAASAIPSRLLERAESVLRGGGGAALAHRVLGATLAPVPPEALRSLRSAVVASLSGESSRSDDALGPLGMASLSVRDGEGRPLVSLGTPSPPAEAVAQPFEAGSARFSVVLWPPPSAEVAAAVVLLLETLFFRPAEVGVAFDFSPAWMKQGIVTADASMEEPYRRLLRFSSQEVTVLVLGESGCGKEAVARAIHRLSGRAGGPFVAVNVAAIPAGVLESELFGHARGAFTGAERERRGLLEEATGGTIFFDEIGELALPLQAKLLRALQERESRRVGENRARPFDARVVSATSRDLAREVEAGRFREDLFYRLHVAIVQLPPLRERGRDAVLLARHFLGQFAREYGRGRLSLAPEATAAIASYGWPGNVRELQNAMAQAAALCDPGGAVTISLLPPGLRPVRSASLREGDYRTRVDAHRRSLIADALDRSAGNRSRAARELGLSRQALLYLIKELKVVEKR